MPSYRKHIFIGAVLSFLYLYFIKWISWYLLFIPIVVYLFSILPDIDTYFGKARTLSFKLLFFLLALSPLIYISIQMNILAILIYLSIIGILGLLIFATRHRGPTHTLWFTILASLPLLTLHYHLFIVATICGFSHVIIDKLFSAVRRFKEGWEGKMNVYDFPRKQKRIIIYD